MENTISVSDREIKTALPIVLLTFRFLMSKEIVQTATCRRMHTYTWA